MATNLKNLSSYNKNTIPSAEEMHFGIVVSEWNSEITESLLQGAVDALIENGAKTDNITIKYVPGTYELALGAQYLLEHADVDTVLCLGCVIQGETRHFDFICNAAAQGIMQVGLEFSTPVIFGVITSENMEQAKDRSGGKHGNKGVEAAITAIKMVYLENELNF
ncbi:MAG: 6,7-dimethyl-8-ribityllumazine synthase [Bacteroidota bacterium]